MKFKTPIKWFALLLLLGLFGDFNGLQATQTDSHGMSAVPLPGKVTIDGKLDDWDLSGEVLMCYDIESLKDLYSAKVSTMYDQENLYLSIHWSDPTPMGNSHDPHYQAAKAWAGDCVQFRIKTDKISHVQCWYYAPKNESAIFIDYGKDLTHPFGGDKKQLFQSSGSQLAEGAEQAFLKDADGKGYVQEIKLPWKLFTDQRVYKAGDSFNLGVELLYGQADWPAHRYADNMNDGFSSREFFFTNYQAWGPMTLEAKGRLTLPDPSWKLAMKSLEASGPVDISYDLPEDSRVTLAIDDASGKRVRNLVPSLSRTKGKNTEHWDGLDDKGLPVPPGTYKFKGLTHHGIHANYVMTFGSPGNPGWDTPDGTGAFYGDHSAPIAVAAAGDYVALGCPIGEAGKYLIGTNLDGQRLWGLANRQVYFTGRLSLATDGNVLWIASDLAGSIYRVESKTGKFSPWKRTARDEGGREFQVLDLPVYDASKTAKQEDAYNMRSISVQGPLLAVAMTKDGVIKLLDKETGDAKGEIKIEEPKALVFEKEGTLVVLSKDRLQRVTTDGKITPLGNTAFPEAYGLAVDSKGTLYLSVRGTDQNVKVISNTGAVLREIGKKGGRPVIGKFDESAMRNPAGIAVDSKDRLWVTESTSNPKRSSVWDTTSGKLVKDLIGTTSYAGAGAINPYDPTMAFSDNTVYQIDLEKGTWKPVYSLGQGSHPDAIFPSRAGSAIQVLQHGKDTLVYTSDRTGAVLATLFHDGEWKAAACTGYVQAKMDSEHSINYLHPLMQAHAGESFAWADKNGDGLVQGDELQFSAGPSTFRGCYWGELPQWDGTIVYVSKEAKGLSKLPIQGYTASGAPIYDISKPGNVPFDGTAPKFEPQGWRGGSNGLVYMIADPLTILDDSGKVLGTYSNPFSGVHGSHNATSARPGLLIGPNTVVGSINLGKSIGDVFSMNGNLGENFLFTSDGLFVQALFKDTRGGFDVPEKAERGMSMDTITAGGESFGAQFVQVPSGKVYLTIGATDARVLELTGFNDLKRFEGSFTYSPELYAKAQDFNLQKSAASKTSKAFVIAKATAALKMEGKGEDWPELADDSKALAEIQENTRTRFGRVAARYDDKNLYLAYRVMMPGKKLRNGGQDFKMLFKTGDVVDLMLGPEKPDKKGVGNLRLILSAMADQPVAVLYEKSIPGTPENNRVPFSSPWRTIYFDKVTQLSEVKIVISPYTKGGCLVEAAIPWDKLGIKAVSGLKLSGDFGILSADGGGVTTISRKYWSNGKTGLVNDVPGEADLEPGSWGQIVLE